MESNRKFMSWRELLLILLLLFLAAAAGAYFFTAGPSRGPLYAVITVQGGPEMHLPLAEDTFFPLPQNPEVIIRVEGGAVFFHASDCPDQLCVRMGKQRLIGQAAVCLPNRVIVTVTDFARQTP